MAVNGAPATAKAETDWFDGEDAAGRLPGSRRLGLGGLWLAGQSLLTAWSLTLVAIGSPALDFTCLGVRVASHPGPFVLNDVSFAPLVALVIVLPVALLGVVAGSRVWLGWPPRGAVIASLLWIVLGLCVGLAGGGLDLLLTQVVLLALIVSGALARLPPGTTALDLLRGTMATR